MNIKSENIKEYIELNYDIYEVNDINDLSKVCELVINKYDYSLKEAYFDPYELNLFRCLKKITFINMDIDEVIIENIRSEKIIFNNCKYVSGNIYKVEDIILDSSSIELLNKVDNSYLNSITIINMDMIDINNICRFNNIEKLRIYNTNIINSNELVNINSKCDIEIKGSKMDDMTIINKLNNIKYSIDKYFKN